LSGNNCARLSYQVFYPGALFVCAYTAMQVRVHFPVSRTVEGRHLGTAGASQSFGGTPQGGADKHPRMMAQVPFHGGGLIQTTTAGAGVDNCQGQWPAV